jgi:pimeloyl-ACP methyl ester carboxylesterase
MAMALADRRRRRQAATRTRAPEAGEQVAATRYSRSGAGEPLVLLHGLGASRGAWEAIVPALAQRFDVIAVDLPGFGASAPLPAEIEPSPAELAAAVAGPLNDLGIDQPHLAGNSLGGWVAMELAKIRPVRSVTLLSPAGLWRAGTPLYCMVSLRLSRWLAKHAGPTLSKIVATRPGRVVVLGQMLAHPARLPAAQARSAVQALGTCPGFDATLKATAHRRLRGAQQIKAPVTVAFGSRDVVLLRRQSRHLGELSPDTRSATLPGCGHLPMTDDPARVADLIITATSRSRQPDGPAGLAHRAGRTVPGHDLHGEPPGADGRVGLGQLP